MILVFIHIFTSLPNSPAHHPGTCPALLRLPLWYGAGWRFSIISEFLGVKLGWMLGWVFAGGGTAQNIISMLFN
jgi:hypothetical protein